MSALSEPHFYWGFDEGAWFSPTFIYFFFSYYTLQPFFSFIYFFKIWLLTIFMVGLSESFYNLGFFMRLNLAEGV
uniref:Uncharacterized protein n=1 Tax=Gossypium raimondii TaxID=29730 RepID=A0A0D2UD82_GOSRA|nr:hypothetical protein B456_009G228300 [Gossypium raimondii]